MKCKLPIWIYTLIEKRWSWRTRQSFQGHSDTTQEYVREYKSLRSSWEQNKSQSYKENICLGDQSIKVFLARRNSRYINLNVIREKWIKIYLDSKCLLALNPLNITFIVFLISWGRCSVIKSLTKSSSYFTPLIFFFYY